jgi:hypothetical protein
MHQTLRIPCLLGPPPSRKNSQWIINLDLLSAKEAAEITEGVTVYSGTVPGIGGYGGPGGWWRAQIRQRDDVILLVTNFDFQLPPPCVRTDDTSLPP